MESETHQHEIAEVEGEIKEVKREIDDLEHREHELEEELEHLEHEYPIQVNREHFIEKRRYITGSDILKLVGEDDGKHGVAILRGGGEHDIPVGLEESVDLAEPKNHRFKTFPDKSTEG